MKGQRMLVLLTLANLGIMMFQLFRESGLAEAGSAATILRARGLEIIGDQGKVRASIHILPAGPSRGPSGAITKDGKFIQRQYFSG